MDTSRVSIRSLSLTGTVAQQEATERDSLLGSSSRTVNSEQVKKSWYRPRPLWIVPFAITAALCRSMTLAPRTEVFTQLACEELRPSRHHHTLSHHRHVLSFSSIPTNFSLSHAPGFLDIEAVPFVLDTARVVHAPSPAGSIGAGGEEEPGIDFPVVEPPAIECLTDPAVQAGAAKLQTIMTTTMGVLSALTTGWWGQFGDQHGRTKVIACAVAGLLFTDIMFIIASNPPEALKGHAHKLLVVAPVVEGLLGGWSTMQAATYAYISDCTSHGSRAHIFSRFTGVFFIGIAFGPEIAALILRKTHRTTLVFYTSAVCAFVNLLLLLFVYPESLSNDVRVRNFAAAHEAQSKLLQDTQGKGGLWHSAKSTVTSFIKPLGILGPRPRAQGRGQDWSMTMLSMALFCHFLTLGLFQIKYLYAEHVFSWDAEELSYYITTVGSARALHLLVVLPFAIRLFKPKTSVPKAKGKISKGKVAPSPAALSTEIKFDLLVGKIAVGLDLISHVSVTLAQASSQSLFVGLTTISALGAGLVPALQSVAMSVMLLRGEGGNKDGDKGGAEIGKLFGAIAVLQAVGSMILGPMLFGTVYSLTVARYPKAIFVLAAGLLVVAVALLLLIRRPRVDVPIRIRVDTRVEVEVERARGRSRKSKDIR